MSALLTIAILVGLILVHELGHFSVAKLFGIRVDQFNVGFPPRLLKVQIGETLYSFNLILIGGYVQIHGEDIADSNDPRALASRPRVVQGAVLLAGIVFNLAFAWLLLSAGYMAGLPTSVEHEGVGTVTNAHPMIVAVVPNSPADKAGIMGGDIVERIDTGSDSLDARTLNTDQQAMAVRNFIGTHPDDSLVITVLRDGEEKTFLAKAAEGIAAGRKAVGIELDDVGTLKLSPPLALWEGGILAKNIIIETGAGLGDFLLRLVRGTPDFSQVSGPIGIVSLGGVAVREGAAAVLVLAASISIALGLFNLVPIPGLDGGRLAVVLIEGVMRRPLPPKVMTGLTLTGIALVLALLVAVSYHDVVKLIG